MSNVNPNFFMRLLPATLVAASALGAYGQTSGLTLAGRTSVKQNLLKTYATPVAEASSAASQQRNGKSSNAAVTKLITGTVTDSQGEPLIGATVMAGKGKNAAVVDASGKFSLNVAPGETVTVSMVGLSPVKFKVTDQSTYDIVMKSADETLDDLVYSINDIKY